MKRQHFQHHPELEQLRLCGCAVVTSVRDEQGGQLTIWLDNMRGNTFNGERLTVRAGTEVGDPYASYVHGAAIALQGRDVNYTVRCDSTTTLELTSVDTPHIGVVVDVVGQFDVDGGRDVGGLP